MTFLMCENQLLVHRLLTRVDNLLMSRYASRLFRLLLSGIMWKFDENHLESFSISIISLLEQFLYGEAEQI